MALKYYPTSAGNALIVGLSSDTKPVLPADGLTFLEEDTAKVYTIASGVWTENLNSTYATAAALALKSPIASPTFTGTVTIPTPFTIGATSMTSTATELNILDGATLSTSELNFVDGVTSAIQTQLDAKQATLVSGTNIKTINGSTLLGSGDLTVSASFPRGYLWGLKMSNAADTANDITVAAGQASCEGGGTDMVLEAPITKRMDAGWAVGDAQGGLNTGAEANSTWYEVHLIKRTDTGVVDVMFTTTANRATLPANYTKQRRIGWIRNDGAGALLQFTQVDDYITLTTAINDLSATATASETARTLTVPPNSIARFRAACLGNTNVNAGNAIVFREIVEADTAPTTSNGLNSIGSGDFAIIGAGHIELRVSATSTIGDQAITATGSMAYDISTFGWIDHRGKMSDI